MRRLRSFILDLTLAPFLLVALLFFAFSGCGMREVFDSNGVRVSRDVYFGPTIFNAPEGTSSTRFTGLGLRLTMGSILIGAHDDTISVIDHDCFLLVTFDRSEDYAKAYELIGSIPEPCSLEGD